MVLLIISFEGCKDRKEEVIDLNDIIAESDRYKEGESEEDIVKVELDSASVILNAFKANGINAISLSFLEDNLFPDRFGPEASYKYQLYFDADTVKFYNWNYSDSVKTVNAFFNWIDNFGKRKKSIFVGEEKNFQKDPLLFFIGDTSLIFIEAKNKLFKKNWIDYFEKNGFKGDWNYVVTQTKWGRAKWDSQD